jgi:hypothetical protein
MNLKGEKMLKPSRCFIFAIIFLGLCVSCSSPTNESEVTDLENSYTPLAVGIEKQYLNLSDSTYSQSKISAIAFREDQQKVFVTEKIDFSSPLGRRSQSYNFVEDGFLYSTSLAKKEGESTFYESCIAKVQPKSGDEWLIVDSGKGSFKAHYIGIFETPAGIFEDVYNFQYFDQMINDSTKVYYAKGIGNIGSSSKQWLSLVSWIKIGEREYGKKEIF